MSKPLIAVDFDDVLSRSNEAIAAAFGKYFPPHEITLDSMATHYWKTPHWGNAAESVRKIGILFGAGVMKDVPPLQPDLARPLNELRERGYALCIITARPPSLKQQTLDWIAKNLPDGTFEHIVFTGAYQHLTDPDHQPPSGPSADESTSKAGKAQITDAHAADHPDQAKAAHDAVQPALSAGNKKKAVTKAEVIKDLGACALIDDSLEHCLDCHKAGIKTYLFSPLPPTADIPVPHWPWSVPLLPSFLFSSTRPGPAHSR